MVYNLTLAVNYLDVNMDGYCHFEGILFQGISGYPQNKGTKRFVNLY